MTKATASLLPPAAARPPAQPRLTVSVAGTDDLALLGEPDIDGLILPLSPANVRAATGAETTRKRLAWELPPIIFDHQWHEYAAMLQQLYAQGHRHFRLNNLSHFLFFDGMADAKLTAGARLYTLNSLAALAWRELGATALSLAIEDDRQNLRELLARDPGIPLWLTVFTPVELLQSRIPIRGVNNGDLLQTATGEAFQVTTDRGLTMLAATVDFSLTGQLRAIQEWGGGNWHLDLSRCGALTERGAAVLAALREDRELPDATLFNFGRGLA